MQGQAGTDHLHAAIGLQVCPVDENDRLLAAAEHLRGQRAIDAAALALQRRIAQQPIHAFDSVAHAGVTRQCACQVGQGVAARCKRGLYRLQQAVQPALVQHAAAARERLPQNLHRMHGGVSQWLVWKHQWAL